MAAISTFSNAVGGAVNGAKEAVAYTVPAVINGKDVHTSKTFDVLSPSTGKLVHHSSSASVPEVIQAIEAAQKAFPAWRDTPQTQKRDLFLKAADVMERRANELGQYMIDETGSGTFWASAFNVPLAADALRDIAGRLSSVVGLIPTPGPGKSALMFKEPWGVILGIAPWNAPYILGVRAIAAAIAVGNTAVLKGSELSPRCFWAIADCFREAGFPEGVLNVFSTKKSEASVITKTLIEHPSIRKINFTGSTGVGRIIAELAGKNLKPVLLELGGKAPTIVWKDADLKLAAQQCALGSFLHAGQICMATERIIVHESIAAEFEKELKVVVKEGFAQAEILINEQGVEKNKRLLKDALGKGAILLNGDINTTETSATRMAPIVVKDVTADMDIYHMESFGPTVSLITIETEEEAIRLANDTEYGLSAAVFTEDLRTGLRLAKSIESGAVHINGMTVHDETALPHGGTKASGYGRFGAFGLDEWVWVKTVTYKG